MFRLFVVLLGTALCVACDATDDRAQVYDSIPQPGLNDTVQPAAPRDPFPEYISEPFWIRQLGSGDSIMLRSTMYNIISYDSSGNAVDSFGVGDLYGWDKQPLNDTLLLVVVQRKTTAAILKYTHILALENGRFRYTLGAVTVDSAGFGFLAQYDDYVHYSVRVRPAGSATALELREQYMRYSRFKRSDNQAWSNRAVVQWDTARRIYRNDFIDLWNVQMVVPDLSNEYPYAVDTVTVTDVLPGIRLRESIYVYYLDAWFHFYPEENRLFSTQ